MTSNPLTPKTDHPIDSQTVFAALRDALAELYPEEQDARVVVADAGLDARLIAFSSRAQTNWHNILTDAANTESLNAILNVARAAYGNNSVFMVAYNQYLQFIDKGRRIEAPGQPPTADEFVYGDKVGGDTITAGNITAPVAIGDGATVTVIHPAPLPRIPLERPARAEYFQNRKHELAQLLVDLQAGRVVTLCGPGGIGKTALAAEAVWQLAPGDAPPERFPGGIFLHSFYNQAQTDVVFEAVARSFGEEPWPTPQSAAKRALAGRRALLILDGAEEATDLDAVLAIRGQCGVLITSRQRKDARSVRYDVAPLPQADAITLLQALGGKRATDITAVQHICEVVNGLPLAVYLAGSYLAEWDQEETEYVEWLTETPLAALDLGKRQRESIPLLLERSLDRVSEDAKQALSIIGLLALAPFGQESIAQPLTISPVAARKALSELVNYGLLRRRAETYEVTHALIHTYARRRLPPDMMSVIRLANYYKGIFAIHSNEFDLLNSLRPHVMGLIRLCCEREAWPTVQELARAINSYLDLRGHWTDRITVCQAELASAQAQQDRQAEGVHLGSLGRSYYSIGQQETGTAYFKQALVIAREVGDRHSEGSWLGSLGDVYHNLGQVEQALAYYDQALMIAQGIGDRDGEGEMLGALGKVYHNLGQVEQTLTYYDQALTIAQEIGNQRSRGNWLGSLGIVYHNLGQIEQATPYYDQALTIARELGHRSHEVYWLGSLGLAYADLGQMETAIIYYQQALTILKDFDDLWGEGKRLSNRGLLPIDLKHAQRAAEQALHIFEEIKSPHADTIRKVLAPLQSK